MRRLSNSIFYLLLTIALYGAGGYLTLQAIRNREPTTVTAKELEKQLPSSGWLTITHARLNLEDRCFMTKGNLKEPTEVFIPIRSRRDEGGIFISALLKSSNKEYLDPKQALIDLEDVTVNGTVESGSLNSKQVESHFFGKLKGEYLVINDGDKPNLLYGILLLLLALAATYFFYLRGFLNASRKFPLAPPDQPSKADGISIDR